VPPKLGPTQVDDAPIPGAVRGPLPDKPAPQLATLSEAAPAGDQWLHEIKFDGYRMLVRIDAGKARFISRNGLDWTTKFPALAAAVGSLGVSQAILDGEVCHELPNGATSFGALQADLSEGKTANVVFFAFDLLYLDGWDLAPCRLVDRKWLPNRLTRTVRYSEHHLGDGPEFFAAAAAAHLEGIISKRLEAPYQPGRGPAWLKTKALGREELVVVGFTDPERSRVGFGALLLGYYNSAGILTYAGKVGTGYSDKVLTSLRLKLETLRQTAPTVTLPKGISRTGVHWVAPEIVVETSFTEWTSDGILRHPVFIGVREDKPARDVVLDRKLNPEAKTTHWGKGSRRD
jgi:bifunctional non-homologous end joining protein LigD